MQSCSGTSVKNISCDCCAELLMTCFGAEQTSRDCETAGIGLANDDCGSVLCLCERSACNAAGDEEVSWIASLSHHHACTALVRCLSLSVRWLFKTPPTSTAQVATQHVPTAHTMLVRDTDDVQRRASELATL